MSLNFKDVAKYRLIECISSSGTTYIQIKSSCKIPFGIILPSMYHIKIATLPVNSEYKAKKLADAIFDGFLPKNKKFKFIAKKIANSKFCLIAYCEEDIFKQVKETNSNNFLWFFAQFAIKENIEIGQSALINSEDLILELPKNIVNEKLKNSALASCDFLKSIFYFQKPKNISELVLTTSLSVLIVCFFTQATIYASSLTSAFLKSSEISQNQDGIDAKIAELKTIADRQNAIRKSFDLFAQTKTVAKLESMKYENSKLSAVFLTQNQTKFKSIITPFNPQAIVLSGDSASIQLQVGEQ